MTNIQKNFTFAALENAVLAGYPSFENIKTDSALASARSDPSWNTKLSDLKSSSTGATSYCRRVKSWSSRFESKSDMPWQVKPPKETCD